MEMVEAVAEDGWCRENPCLTVEGFEGEDEDSGCMGVLGNNFSGRHIQRWRWILPEVHAGHRRQTPMASELRDYFRRW